MSNKQRKHKFDLLLNQVKRDESDPTKVHVSMIILDTELSGNNVEVSEETLLDAKHTILGMPIVAKYIKVSEENANDDDFGDHEMFLSKDKNGNDSFERDTIAIGSFTSEGYMTTVNIDGEDRRVFVADGVLWYSRYKDACDLLIKWFNEDKKINMSCEYLFSNYAIVDGKEVHLSPIYFEGHCVLGESVVPAYDSATILSVNQLQEFNRLVAQASNQEDDKKEVNDLEDKDLQTNEELKDENLDSTEEEKAEPDTEKDDELKTQTNAVSLYDISDAIRSQVKANEKGEDYVWVSDLYTDHAIVAIEYDGDYSHYKFNYKIEDDKVVVDLESKVEVKEKREWVTVTNSLNDEITQLNNKINELTTSKLELVEKYDSATETITQLNSQLEELKPLKEQIELAQKEAELTKAKETFETKFNSVGASELFTTKEMQTLVAQSIEGGEVGLNAKLALNEKIVELASKKLETNSSTVQTIMNTASKRENLIDIKQSFEEKYSV